MEVSDGQKDEGPCIPTGPLSEGPNRDLEDEQEETSVKRPRRQACAEVEGTVCLYGRRARDRELKWKCKQKDIL